MSTGASGWVLASPSTTSTRAVNGDLHDFGYRPRRYGSGGPYEDTIGYSRVVTMNGIAWTAGTTALVNGAIKASPD